MRRSENATEKDETALNAATVVFGVSPAWSAQAARAWRTQDRLRGEMGKFSTAWFRRRHDAARSALDACTTVAATGTHDPAAALAALAGWQAGMFERLAEDIKDSGALWLWGLDALAGEEKPSATTEGQGESATTKAAASG